MRALRITGQAFWMPKAGHLPEEYEDAWAGPSRVGKDWVAAVADGATEAAFSKIWARSLAHGMALSGADTGLYEAVLKACRAEWQEEVKPLLRESPWYVAAKAREGAFAAFLVVSWSPDGTWQALAVGDCCLLHVREGRLLSSWPMTSSEQFSNRPQLVASRSGFPEPSVVTHYGGFNAGDVFWLATDALAAFFLSHPWEEKPIRNRRAFEDMVHEGRAKGRLHNDDVTLLAVEVDSR